MNKIKLRAAAIVIAITVISSGCSIDNIGADEQTASSPTTAEQTATVITPTLIPTQTPTPTATPIPTPTPTPFLYIEPETILSEIPDNIHIDEDNQTVAVSYDAGDIIYSNATYIGVSYIDEYYDITRDENNEITNIRLIAEDVTLTKECDDDGFFWFPTSPVDGKRAFSRVHKDNVYIHRKAKYYIETEYGIVIESDMKSLIKLEDGIIAHFYGKRKYTTDLIKEYNFAITYGDVSILIDNLELNMNDIPYGPEEKAAYLIGQENIPTIRGFMQFLLADRNDIGGFLNQETRFSEYYFTRGPNGSTSVSGTIMNKAEIQGYSEFRPLIRLILAPFEQYPGMTDKDLYNFLELERLKENVLIANERNDNAEIQKAYQELIDEFYNPEQKLLSLYLATLNVVEQIKQSHKETQFITINGEPHAPATIESFLMDYNTVLSQHLAGSPLEHSMSVTLSEMDFGGERVRIPDLSQYKIKTDTKATKEENIVQISNEISLDLI